eukprot:1157965-Pelagomonas_calceolata.AAC.1
MTYRSGNTKQALSTSSWSYIEAMGLALLETMFIIQQTFSGSQTENLSCIDKKAEAEERATEMQLLQKTLLLVPPVVRLLPAVP